MNRIRQYNREYQVLETPHQKYNSSFEFLIGSWTDVGLSGFNVKTYDNYDDAENNAQQYPDINWNQLINYHKDNYDAIKNKLVDIINQLKMVVTFSAKLMTPMELKNIMFDRVLHGQKCGDFRLVFDMNDIISFKITNPWMDNLRELENFLVNSSDLRLFSRYENDKLVHLIGKTSIGTTYDIILCPDIIDNLITWKKRNNVNDKTFFNSLKRVSQIQNIIDSSFCVR